MTDELIGEEWREVLKYEFNKPYFKRLLAFISQKKKVTKVFPGGSLVFKAYKTLPYKDVRVVFVGQDPYPNNHASGLAFDTQLQSPPVSLKAFLAAMNIVEPDFSMIHLGGLKFEGVMFLNRILTVDEGMSMSHKGMGWETFTKETIKELNKKEDKVCFVFIGSINKDLLSLISDKHFAIWIEHPAYASRQNRAWDFKDCFNKINEELEIPVNWNNAILPF